jgi:GxxExxY protein
MVNLKFPEESFQIRGAVYEVYREMGCGFLESVYQECLEKNSGNSRSRSFPSQPWLLATRENR